MSAPLPQGSGVHPLLHDDVRRLDRAERRWLLDARARLTRTPAAERRPAVRPARTSRKDEAR